MLSPLGFVMGHLGPDAPCYAHLGVYWAIWMTQTALTNWDSTGLSGPNMHNRAHMSRVCQPRSHLNLKLDSRGGMFSQERSFDEVRILLQIKIIYTGDIV